MNIRRGLFIAVVTLTMFVSAPAFATHTVTLNYPPSFGISVAASDCAHSVNDMCMALVPPFVSQFTSEMELLVQNTLNTASMNFENGMKNALSNLFSTLLSDMDGMEKSMSKAWMQGWRELILEGLKAMNRQLNVNMTTAAEKTMVNQDAKLKQEIVSDNDILLGESDVENSPSVHANIASFAAGGYGRAREFSKAMQKTMAQEIIDIGLNKSGDASRVNGNEYTKARFETYKSIFCDPASNEGNLTGVCTGTDADYYNADIQPNKFLLSRHTLPISPEIDPDAKMFKTLKAIRLNLFGSPFSEPPSAGVLKGHVGQEKFLDKRSYLARYGAIMAPHNLIEGWRMPGSDQGTWIKNLLDATNNPGINEWYTYRDNPSYKEIMYAMTNERFNSGHYATDLISGASDIKMEKIVLTSLQLMRLRDYYELLERTALVLAVQVAMLSEDIEQRASVSGMSTSKGSD